MLALELSVNDHLVATIGDAAGTARVQLLASQGSTRGAQINVLLFALADQSSGSYLHWETPTLSVGDTVSIRLVEAAFVSPYSFATPVKQPYWQRVVGHAWRSLRGTLHQAFAEPRSWVRTRLTAPLAGMHRILFDTTAHAHVAFELHVRGQRVCVAGMPKPGMLTAHVTHSATGKTTPTLRLFGGAFSAKANLLHWDSPDIAVGDVVQLRLLSTSATDAPSRRAAKMRGRTDG